MAEPRNADRHPWAVFLIFLRLGLTSFGGPIAHLGYFRQEFVERRQWLSERSYADLVGLCQFLPGPASSQVGMALGLSRCGYRGAVAAWAGFTLPSAVLLVLCAQGLARHADAMPAGLLQGLKIAAVAVVAQAVWGMARAFCTDVPRLLLMAAVACFVVWVPSTWAQVGSMGVAAVAGLWLRSPATAPLHDVVAVAVRPAAGLLWLGLFLALLLGLPALHALYPNQVLALLDTFYRAGSLVFGGGHVVLPLLQSEVVPSGWVSADTFLAGYGLAQAVPGPLFTFAAFLGASLQASPTGWLGASLCLAAIFAPSFLLVVGVLPFWEPLRRTARMRAALAGINAAVVGLLLAALYTPMWTDTIHTWLDVALTLMAGLALMVFKWPAWLVVPGAGAAAAGLAAWPF